MALSYLTPPGGAGGGADPLAIHVNVGGEINLIAAKAAPVAADIVVIEDSAALFVKKKVVLDGADVSAIHDNVAGEINAIAAKAVPVAADLVLIEDSAAANAKKKVTLQNLSLGYTLYINQGLSGGLVDGETFYFGAVPMANRAVAGGQRKLYIPKAGIIKICDIYSYAGTIGTNEAWSMYVRVNDAADTLIATVSLATAERIWNNTALNIAVSAGDFIEIKSVCPTWATNPSAVGFGGHLYIEKA